MRRFLRLRGLVTGFALIGLFTAVLAAATSGPAHATTTGAPVFNNLKTGTGGPCPSGQLQPCQVMLADSTDHATFSTPITATAKDPGSLTDPVTVSCPGLPAMPMKLVTPATHQYLCTATDLDDNLSATATVSLTALDQPTVVHTPIYPQPVTADATDTATVSYPPVTASETPTGESDAITPGCVPVGPGPTSATSGNAFVSSGTFPVGVTTLYCTASDNFDGLVLPVPPYQFLKVTVADQPVTLTVPTTQLAQATSSSGATVSYSPVAAEGSETEAVGACSADKPAASSADGFVSGGNFPVGGTTLTCTATDNVDGTSTAPPPSQSFTVIVTKTPCAALAGCNLHGLDLSNAILAGADLSSGTDLSNANLDRADLSGASLAFANLSFANLSRANLNQADLTGANLTGANLNHADLTDANLTGANLTGANLTNAKLDGVTWNNTTCPDGTNSSASTPQTCAPAPATTTIGNTPPWNGSLSSNFGVSGAPNNFTPTMGQTVTVPATDTVLHSFTFYADLPANLLFRGEVYAWNPNTVDPANPYASGSATGSALYESGQMHTSSYGSGLAPQPITFNIRGGLPLTAGAQYVLFFTTSRDYAANAAANITDTGFVGYTATDTYSGGDLVYVDDGGDPGQWITKVWTHPAGLGCPPCFNQDDLAFSATFSSH